MRHHNVFVVAGINLTLLLVSAVRSGTTEAAIIYATSARVNPLFSSIL